MTVILESRGIVEHKCFVQDTNCAGAVHPHNTMNTLTMVVGVDTMAFAKGAQMLLTMLMILSQVDRIKTVCFDNKVEITAPHMDDESATILLWYYKDTNHVSVSVIFGQTLKEFDLPDYDTSVPKSRNEKIRFDYGKTRTKMTIPSGFFDRDFKMEIRPLLRKATFEHVVTKKEEL